MYVCIVDSIFSRCQIEEAVKHLPFLFIENRNILLCSIHQKRFFLSCPATLHSQKECDCVSNSVLRSPLVFLSFHDVFAANTVSTLNNTSSEMFLLRFQLYLSLNLIEKGKRNGSIRNMNLNFRLIR